MIFELVQARGIKAWFNGCPPIQRWGYGDEIPGEIVVSKEFGDVHQLRFPTDNGVESYRRL